MPVYTFYNTKTGEEETKSMPYEDMKTILRIYPYIERRFQMNIGDPVRLGVRKSKSGMREVLNKVKKAHPRGTVRTDNISEI